MKTNTVDNLLKAINLANYDNLKTVEIEMKDLMLIRKHILELRSTVEHLSEQILKRNMTINNLNVKLIKRPVSLNVYI